MILLLFFSWQAYPLIAHHFKNISAMDTYKPRNVSTVKKKLTQLKEILEIFINIWCIVPELSVFVLLRSFSIGRDFVWLNFLILLSNQLDLFSQSTRNRVSNVHSKFHWYLVYCSLVISFYIYFDIFIYTVNPLTDLPIFGFSQRWVFAFGIFSIFSTMDRRHHSSLLCPTLSITSSGLVRHIGALSIEQINAAFRLTSG